MKEIESELNLHMWAVISATNVLSNKLTHSQALSEAFIAESKGESGVCVVTQIIANRVIANKYNKLREN